MRYLYIFIYSVSSVDWSLVLCIVFFQQMLCAVGQGSLTTTTPLSLALLCFFPYLVVRLYLHHLVCAAKAYSIAINTTSVSFSEAEQNKTTLRVEKTKRTSSKRRKGREGGHSHSTSLLHVLQYNTTPRSRRNRNKQISCRPPPPQQPPAPPI